MLTGAPPRIVIVTAASTNQSAIELPELGHELFSYYCLAALNQASPRIGLGTIVSSIASSIRALGFDQGPIMEDSDGNANIPLS